MTGSLQVKGCASMAGGSTRNTKCVRWLPIFVLCGLILPSVAPAQEVSLGARIGGGLSFLGGSDWNDALNFLVHGRNKVRSGFTVGAFLSFQITQGFCIQSGIAYTRTGGAYDYFEDTMLFETVDGTVTASALELPLLLAPQFPAGTGRLQVFIGPDVILLLGDIEYKEEAAGISASAKAAPDNSLVLGMKAGIAYVHPAGAGDVVVELSYTRTLTEIFEDDNTAVNAVLATVGYQIRL